MQWRNLTSPGWQELNLWAEQKWAGHGHRPQFRVTGNRVDFRGRVARADGGNFTAGRSEGWGIGTVPGVSAHGMSSIASAGSAPSVVKMSVDNGTVRVYLSGDASWVDLGGGVAWLD